LEKAFPAQNPKAGRVRDMRRSRDATEASAGRASSGFASRRSSRAAVAELVTGA
jgi:hypothetical protein